MADNITFKVEPSILKLYKNLKADYKKEGKTAAALFKDMIISYSEQRKQEK